MDSELGHSQRMLGGHNAALFHHFRSPSLENVSAYKGLVVTHVVNIFIALVGFEAHTVDFLLREITRFFVLLALLVCFAGLWTASIIRLSV